MATTKQPRATVRPDAVHLSSMAATRLSAISGIHHDKLIGKSVADLRVNHEWAIDPELLLFRRVCGRVVRHDPVSGEDWGVPGATVHVYDTDVSLFGYFPGGWQYCWYWPFQVRREQIASAVTDACGNFCVWIPRFDIDWILRWRRERVCFSTIFVKPNLRDLLERLAKQVEIPKHIGPDPGPLQFLRGGINSAGVLEAAVGVKTARKLQQGLRTGAGATTATEALLGRRAFVAPMPPPASPRLAKQIAEHVDAGHFAPQPAAGKTATARPAATAASAAVKGTTAATFRSPDLRAWIGPFYQCVDHFIPEFTPILDVPDISFGVTQDVDGDGDEETIYAEGLFDVRWNAGAIPSVTLVADPSAFATPTCAPPPPVGACAEPGIVVVGQMPLLNPSGPGAFPIVDAATGYAVRANRPHASGQPGEVPAAAVRATAPVEGLLEFWGCNHHLLNGTAASHYRINCRVSSDGGATFGPAAPIIDTWSNWRSIGSPPVLDYKAMAQLPGGWWEVLNPAENWIPGDKYLLQWHNAPNGLVELTLELGQLGGGGVVTPIGSATPVRLVIDNSAPVPTINSIAWRTIGGALNPLPLNCPTIARARQAIEIVIDISATAAHLRSLVLTGSGCGSGNPTLKQGFEAFEGLVVPPALPAAAYWHKSPLDNALTTQVVWSVPAALPPGAYGFALTAYSRAFSPGDGHVYTPTNPDLGYDPAPVWTYAQTTIAIVD